MDSKKYQTVGEYIKSQPRKTQKKLNDLRALIRKNASKSEEMISYNMPAYKLNGPLVYFAAYENHIGFYPLPSAIKKFQKEIAFYKTSKGAIQLPLTDELPVKLISAMLKFRVKENQAKASQKSALPKKNNH